MDVAAAAKLIAKAVPRTRATWCDLGAGTGTFSRALASLLEPGSVVYVVEKDPNSVKSLRKLSQSDGEDPAIIPVQGDFTAPLDLPRLDGLLYANSLHYVPYDRQREVLGESLTHLGPDGRLVVVDYDGRGPNRWVPYPVSKARFGELARALSLGEPEVVGERPSAYGGLMYAAVAMRE